MRTKAFCAALALWGLNPCGEALSAGETMPTAAVLDFAVPPESSNTWAWARNGLADLLQIELNQRGLDVLDRCFIQAVLSERRMAVGGLTALGSGSPATLLGAKYLISGKAVPLADGRCTIEASAFLVETAETVATGTGTGKLPKDLPGVLGKVADEIVHSLLRGHEVVAVRRGAGNLSYEPEALIAYYRGLDAHAAGFPEIAAAWFLDSAGLAPGFAPAQMWEIKAYRAAGFESHARIRERETAALMKRAGMGTAMSNGVSQAGMTSVAILKPSVIQTAGHSLPVNAASAMERVKAGLLKAPEVRLIDPADIAASLIEQDRKLSGLFSSLGETSYGHWTMADVLFFFTVEGQSDGQVVVTFSLRDSVSLSVKIEDRTTVAGEEVAEALQAGAARLIGKWRNRDSGIAVPSAPGGRAGETGQDVVSAARSQAEGDRLEGLPKMYREIAVSLIGINRDEKKRTEGNRGALVNCFSALHRYSQAAEEYLQMLKCVDLTNPDTAGRLSDWADQYDGFCLRDYSRWPWYRDPKYGDEAMRLLLANFPDSIYAANKRLWLASNYWETRNWSKAQTNAVESRRVLSEIVASPDVSAAKDEWERDRIKSERQTYRSGIVTAYYIEADCLANRGHTNESARVMTEAVEFTKKYDPPLNFPRAVLRDFMGYSKRIVSGAGPAAYKWREGVHPGCYAAKAAGLLGETDSLSPLDQANACVTLMANLQSSTDFDAAADRLITIFETSSRTEGSVDSLLPAIEKGLFLYSTQIHARGFSDRKLRLLLCRTGKAMFDAGKTQDVGGELQLSEKRQTDIGKKVIELFEANKLESDWPGALGPCFDKPYPVGVGIALLLRGKLSSKMCIETTNRLAQRLPRKMDDLPFTVWMKYASALSAEGRHREALTLYKKAFAQGAPKLPFAGLAVSFLVEAMNSRPEAVDEEVKRLCVEAAIEPFEPGMAAWFDAGRKFEDAKQFSNAIICYKHALNFVYDSPNHAPTYPWPRDFAWGVEKVQENKPGRFTDGYEYFANCTVLSARYFLARSLIGAGQAEEAAPILRRLIREHGDEAVTMFTHSGEYGGDFLSLRIRVGTEAARLLKELHVQTEASSDDGK